MAKVLVWNSRSDKESGFWASFEGEEISSYVDKGGARVYTLYKCTFYDFEAYRVHIYDETDPRNPTYELHPHKTNRRKPGHYTVPDYTEPYRREDIAENYPRFLKDLG